MDILRDIRIAGKNAAVERSINLSITDRLAEASDESHAYIGRTRLAEQKDACDFNFVLLYSYSLLLACIY